MPFAGASIGSIYYALNWMILVLTIQYYANFAWSVRMGPHYLTLCGLKRLQDGCVRCRRWRRSGACGCNNLWSRKEPCFFGRVKIYLHHHYESPHLMTRKRASPINEARNG